MKRGLLKSLHLAFLVLVVAVASGQVSSSRKHKSTIGKAPQPTSSQQSNPANEPQEQHIATPPKQPVHTGPDIKATDPERSAVTFTSYDLDVRLAPAQQSIAVRALLQVRNDGDQPLVHLPLQISSSLEWETVRIAGKEVPFGLQTIHSDADHTGQLREAIVVLPEPLPPGKQTALDVVYRGSISLESKRLEAIGTPSDLAQRSDWDRISPEFTGLRGFGNVAWYPVSAVPVALGDGAKLFTETGKQKQRQSSATVQMKVSVEYLGKAPDLAVLDGQPVPISATAQSGNEAFDPEVPLIATCKLEPAQLGFASPSLFVASRIEQIDLRSGATGPRMNAYLRPGNELNIDSYLGAMAKTTPLVEQWLGSAQKRPLTLVDLPEADDAPFEAGSVLLAPVRAASPDQLTSVVAHALTHSYFRSPREWLNEGVPYFIGSLGTEQSAGREAALQSLASAPLAMAEPASPADGDSQDLIHAIDPVFYRSKAAYVLWMLRDLIGKDQLAAALRDYDPLADTSQNYFEQLLERNPQDGSAKKDLKWFFDDWVYRDRGLPDLSIQGVYPSKSAAAGSYVVAIDLANDGYATAEVPLTVRSNVTSITERLLVPARQKISHRVLIQGSPVEVTLNDGTVPEMQSSRHATAVDQLPQPQ